MAADEWYYAQSDQQFGPIASSVLQELARVGKLNRADLVWAEGMTQWVAAGTRSELFGVGNADAAPVSPLNVGYAGPASLNYFHGSTPSVRYAGFWLRFAAAFIDGLILVVPGAVASFAINLLGNLQAATTPNPNVVLFTTAGTQAFDIVLRWLYGAVFEASKFQATPGKMACGIIVTDEAGARISFGRATGRHFAKYLSALILLIGYLMAGWTYKRQALHDMLAKTLVVKKGP